MTSLDDVRIFARVAESGSFTDAARLLGLPKSTVSRRVSELEEALATRLIHRSTRKLSLTNSGRLYFERTAHLIAELDDAGRALEELQHEPRGLLRVTTPSDLSSLLRGLILNFQDRYPEVELVVLATGRRVDLVSEGYDVAIRAGVLSDSSLISRRLAVTRLGLFASPDYLTNEGHPTSPGHLVQHRCLVFGTRAPRARWRLYDVNETMTEVEVTGPLSSNDFSFLKEMALAGAGVAMLPRVATTREQESGELVPVLSGYSGEESGLYAMYASRRHLSPKVRAFVDFAADYIERELS